MSLQGIYDTAPSLRELQREMAAQILAADSRPRAPLGRWLAVPPGGQPSERLAVYVDGYPARLHDALLDEFPAVARLIGPARFHALVHRYLRAAGLRSYNLNDAGGELSAMLRDDPLAAELPFLSDLADLEWALTRAFHACEAAPLAPAQLAAQDPQALLAGRVCFQPSVAVRVSPWPIHALWEVREAAPGAIDIDLTVGEQVLVRRVGLDVDCAPIDAGRAAALQSLLAGDALADTAERADDPTAVIAWLGEWLAAGMIVACA
ncbi:MAG TPA: DNA-binding domain-containing protein [Candidatus Dormibacteraeota bacterium]|nr:DNA-binding domain-containing protein [Candidatus Dormibacteraeota bacterium]